MRGVSSYFNAVRVSAAALSIAVTVATLHGRVIDSDHHGVADLKMTFCDAVAVPHQKDALKCGRRRWRTTTGSDGHFSLTGISPGWYINAGKSDEVAWYEGLDYLDPSVAHTITVCSYKAQPHDCSDPRTFGTNIQL